MIEKFIFYFFRSENFQQELSQQHIDNVPHDRRP